MNEELSIAAVVMSEQPEEEAQIPLVEQPIEENDKLASVEEIPEEEEPTPLMAVS